MILSSTIRWNTKTLHPFILTSFRTACGPPKQFAHRWRTYCMFTTLGLYIANLCSITFIINKQKKVLTVFFSNKNSGCSTQWSKIVTHQSDSSIIASHLYTYCVLHSGWHNWLIANPSSQSDSLDLSLSNPHMLFALLFNLLTHRHSTWWHQQTWRLKLKMQW